MLFEIGKRYQERGIPRWAALFYKRVLLLEPANAAAAAKFKEVAAGKTIGQLP
jgi:hypothetical protein